jgi:hypothetical protein
MVHSNSSHPLNPLPKTGVRRVVDKEMSPLSLSTPTICSCTSSIVDVKPPSSGVNPAKRNHIVLTYGQSLYAVCDWYYFRS